MQAIFGNTSTSFYNITYPEGCVLESFSLVNRTDLPVTANLAIKRGSNSYYIIPQGTVLASMYGFYESSVKRNLLANDQIVLAVSGSTDYNFSINSEWH